MTLVLFTDQKAFAAQAAKEREAAEWAMRQNEIERHEKTMPRVGKRRTRDGRERFVVTFYNGIKPKRSDWLALDAKREAEYGREQLERGSWRHRVQKLESFSRSRAVPPPRERKAASRTKPPFQVLFPLPAKGVQMRMDMAHDQINDSELRPETVALTATEKRELRKWGGDVDTLEWADGTKPPPWVKAIGHTTGKWANRDLSFRAAREEREFVDELLSSDCSRTLLSECEDAPATLPPWVKELPPVRDRRKQLASGEIISFLDQHVYPDGGVAEVKRARRREREAFMQTLSTAAAVPAKRRVPISGGGGGGGEGAGGDDPVTCLRNGLVEGYKVAVDLGTVRRLSRRCHSSRKTRLRERAKGTSGYIPHAGIEDRSSPEQANQARESHDFASVQRRTNAKALIQPTEEVTHGSTASGSESIDRETSVENAAVVQGTDADVDSKLSPEEQGLAGMGWSSEYVEDSGGDMETTAPCEQSQALPSKNGAQATEACALETDRTSACLEKTAVVTSSVRITEIGVFQNES